MACILIVDDNAGVLQSLGFYLQSEGYLVVLASSGELGLRLAAEHPVDIVMLDVEMPQMSGLAVCRAIRENPALCHLPVMMMTGRATRDIVALAKTAGAALVLSKPFDLDKLRATFEELLHPAPIAPSPEVRISATVEDEDED